MTFFFITFLMENEEFNVLNYDNTAVIPVAADNLATSDETSCGEFYSHNDETKYAKSHRGAKLATQLGIATASIATILAGGGFLVNAFLPTPPAVSQSEFSLISDSLQYRIELESTPTMDIFFVVQSGESVLVEENWGKEVHYEGTVSLGQSYESVEVVLKSSNGFDYQSEFFRKEIKTQEA